MTTANYLQFLDKAVSAPQEMKLEEVIYLLSPQNSQQDKALSVAADKVRKEMVGDEVHLRAIVEFSNYCRRNCCYCGLRRDNQKLTRYRLEPDEILAVARKVEKLGFKTLVLQSGEDPDFGINRLCQLIETIKAKCDLAVTLSIGEFSYQDYCDLKRAGADRYLLKQETASQRLYHKLHPGMIFTERVQRLQWLRKLGYQIGAGNIIGLPGQSLKSLARDILFYRDRELEMVGMGPFIPHAETPLADCKQGSVDLTLRMLSLTRIMLPKSHLPVTTAVRTLDPQGLEKGLRAGGNVIMPNLTPLAYQKLYEIYPGKHASGNSNQEQIKNKIVTRIINLERKIAHDYGHSIKYLEGS